MKVNCFPLRTVPVRKAAIVSKLDKHILDNIEDGKVIVKEIDTTEAFQEFIWKKSD